MAAPSGVDRQFVMLRTTLRGKIFELTGRKQMSVRWRKRLLELAKRLEEILYRKFPNRNDYYNMMKGPIKPHLLYAVKTLSAQNRQNQQNPQMARDTASLSATMTLHQQMEDMAALSGVDQQFVMLRTTMHEKIFKHIEKIPMSAEWRKRLPDLVNRLERILYRKFPNRNDYDNMMKGPIEPQLLCAVKTLKNRVNQQNPQMTRETASSSSTMTLDENHGDPCEKSASLPADVQNNADEPDRTE
ncbi:hypothetical protein SEVIR_1G091900v4 [Setaria viridis]|uniref:Uncharacterized protein n=1 Tax=Setaria viridis TaxID=4556 RepID=A0A4U6W896_SETVI|nr:uncharacterized protein LOC117866813 isoform X1 [Setaria viridis]TKW38105.1 hypothetical protein SEVIR_1G091900v2 [Setaria viridis]